MQGPGGTDSIKQVNVNVLVVAPTDPGIITGIAPNTITALVTTTILLNGTYGAGDKALFVTTGNCALANLVDDPSGGSLTVTFSTDGIYDLCYRKNLGTDIVVQSLVSLTVNPALLAGDDPVAIFGKTKRDFSVPPGLLVPLLKAPDVTLHGTTFEGGGPWEQWFDRIVAVSPDSQRWVQVAVRKDLLAFNGSGLARGAFESLDVTLGRGSLTEPYATTTLPGVDVPIPVSFLGANVIFRKMHRHYSTAFTTIGRARRECMDFTGTHLHFFVCAAAAGEYYGSKERHLAIKFAHLNLAIVETKNLTALEGILPELWGLQPLSEEAAGYITRGETVKHAAPEGWDQEPTVTIDPSAVMKALAWAGGPHPEDLQKSCSKPNETSETFNTYTV